MATKKNYKSGNNEYFRIRRTIDGKQKSFYGKSKGDAERKYKEYLEEYAGLRNQAQYDSATFGVRAEEYVENALRVSSKFATATIYQYETVYKNYVKDCPLSGIAMSRLRPSDVQKFYNGLDVTMPTINRINKFMTNFCKWAVLNSYCSDFMSAVEIPKKPQNKRHDDIIIWSDEEIRDIFNALDTRVVRQNRHRLTFFVYVSLYTGTRISEALSLRYSDFQDDMVNIQRQYYLKEIKPPKYNSARQIPMHDELKMALADHTEWHEWEMKKNHYKTEYVFTTSSGKLYDPVNVRRALKRLYDANNIPYKHPHAYRATFCTQLCRCGVPLEVASKLMGHKSLEVTAAHYALVRKDTKKDAIDMLHYF